MATTWEAPRWAGVENFIRDQAFLLDLECKVEVTKHLISETGRFAVTGEEEKCKEFKRRFLLAMNDYNKII